MDLNARVDMRFARVDVNFQTITVTIFCYNFFLHFDTNQHQAPTYTSHQISAKYTQPVWGNGLKCVGRRKFFLGPT